MRFIVKFFNTGLIWCGVVACKFYNKIFVLLLGAFVAKMEVVGSVVLFRIQIPAQLAQQ